MMQTAEHRVVLSRRRQKTSLQLCSATTCARGNEAGGSLLFLPLKSTWYGGSSRYVLMLHQAAVTTAVRALDGKLGIMRAVRQLRVVVARKLHLTEKLTGTPCVTSCVTVTVAALQHEIVQKL
jgi:hypothetical protein